MSKSQHSEGRLSCDYLSREVFEALSVWVKQSQNQIQRGIMERGREGRKELRLKGNIEVPFNPAGTPMGLSPEKTRMKKTWAAKAALQPYSQ